MVKNLFVIMLMHFAWVASGQSIITGKVLDHDSKEPLPFVNIIVVGTTEGTSTGIDGRFSLRVSPGNILRFSYVGYNDTTLLIAPRFSQLFTTVYLKQTSRELKAVEVSAGENPAFTIIRRALQNKAQNDPENLKSFTYKAYHKFFATTEGAFDSASLNTSSGKFLDQHHFFVNESFTERKFLKPHLDKEIVVGNRMSGIKDPFFAVLSTSFQPFTFYNDFIPLLDRNYINPLSKGTFNRYDFELKDTIFHAADSTYIISFQPLEWKHFDALQGVLYINTQGYAIEHVLAEPSDEQSKLKIKIQQKYALTGDRWFPSQLNTEFILKDYKIADHVVKYVHRSYISDTQINPSLTQKDFDIYNIQFANDANQKDENFWEVARMDSLTLKERNTYHLYDTLKASQLAALNSLVKLSEAFVVGKFKMGKFYLPIDNLLRINAYEDYRVGIGLQTGEAISNIVTLDAFVAYGAKDKALKYGGGIQFNLNKFNSTYFKFSYSRDVVEPGNSDFIKPPPALYNAQRLRNWLADRMDSVELLKLNFGFRPSRFSEAEIFLKQQQTNPTYAYRYTGKSEAVTDDFTITELGFRYRYSKGERHAKIGKARIITAFDFPQVDFSISQGLNTLEGDFDYTKAQVQLAHQLRTKGLGKISLTLATGWLIGNAPYTSLFNARGADPDKFSLGYFFIPNHFQTMAIYEFTSDRYAFLFLQHDFGRLTSTSSKYFRPELTVVQHFGIGSMRNKQLHEGVLIQSIEKGYYESGMIINNLVRFNYLDLAYLGLGGGIFLRYGPYTLPKRADNIAWKLSLTFSF